MHEPAKKIMLAVIATTMTACSTPNKVGGDNTCQIKDEYVSNVIRSQYSENSEKEGVALHVEDLINEYSEELSEDTLQYCAEKLNLEGIRFSDDSDEATGHSVGFSNPFFSNIHAEEKTTTLNHAVLSSNGNFVVWYTTEGSSATAKENAEQIADGLEQTVSKYDTLTEKKYGYQTSVLSKGKRYKQQVATLKQENIPEKYLGSAMQVYLVNYGESSLAQYVAGYGVAAELIYRIFGQDPMGTVAFPYILMKPVDQSQNERQAQIYNHELFHHYQHYILPDSSKGQSYRSANGWITEATANWASSQATKKSNDDGFLNEWAGVARYQSEELFGSYYEKYGAETTGYASYVFINAINENVNRGSNIIFGAMYEKDPLSYISEELSTDDIFKIQRYLAFMNVSQGYSNYNLKASLQNDKAGRIQNKDTISGTHNKSNVSISPLGIAYYQIGEIPKNNNLTIVKNSNKTGSVLIGKTVTDDCIIIQQDFKNEGSFVYDMSLRDDSYEKVYLAVFNLDFAGKQYYGITVDDSPATLSDSKSDKEQLNPGAEHSTEYSSFISIINCASIFRDDVLQEIDTIYFDENEKIVRYVETYVINTVEEDPEEFLSNTQNYDWLMNVRLVEGNRLITEYTPDYIAEYYSSMTKENLIWGYMTTCSLFCDGDGCGWTDPETSDYIVEDYNPDNYH